MRTQLVDGILGDLLHDVRFVCAGVTVSEYSLKLEGG